MLIRTNITVDPKVYAKQAAKVARVNFWQQRCEFPRRKTTYNINIEKAFAQFV